MADPKDLKIYRYVPKAYQDAETDEPDFALDYKTGLTIRLQPEVSMVLGQVNTITYYSTAVPGALGPTFSDPILREDIVYLRDAGNNAITQTKTITWICEDGTDHADTKVMTKVYTPSESIREGVRRRGNIVTYLKGATVGLLMATEIPAGKTAEEVMDMGRAFIGVYEADLQLFIDAGLPNIHTNVGADTTHAWLNNVIDGNGTTIRAFFLNELNIWGL